MTQVFDELVGKIHLGVNPYDGFPVEKWMPENPHVWDSQYEWFHKMIDDVKPNTIIEVGSFKGGSAIHMAQHLKELNLDAAIICMDTWLSDKWLWLDPFWRSYLHITNGRPDYYGVFTRNVVEVGLTNYIVPLPMSSLAAAALTLDQAQFGNEPLVGNPWAGVKNKISIKAYPRTLASLAEIWRLAETPSLAPDQSITLWATYHDANYVDSIAQDVVAAQATTNYITNTDSGRGGTDLTASFSVTTSIFAGSAKLVVTNNHATLAGYITLLKLRGKALVLLNVSASISENSASQTTYGKHALTLELPMQQNILVATDLLDWLLSWLKDPLPTMEVEIIDYVTTQFPYDLGTYLTLTSSYLGLNKRFRICKIRHESAGGLQVIKTIWTLEPVDQQTAYWQLDIAGFGELGTTTRLAY